MTCRYSFKVLLAALFFFSCISLCAQGARGSSVSLTLGLEAYARSDWDSAIRNLRQASSESPSDPEPFFWLIMAQISKGDYQDAFSSIERFMRFFRNNRHAPTVLYQKGRVEFLTSRHGQAMETLASFVNANPTHRLVPSAYYWMGEVCFATGQYDDAKSLYEFLIESWPQSAKHEAASYRLALIEQKALEEELISALSGIADSPLVEELEASLSDERKRNSSLEEEVALLEAQNEALLAAIAAAGIPLPGQGRPQDAHDTEWIRNLEELIRKYVRAREIYEVK